VPDPFAPAGSGGARLLVAPRWAIIDVSDDSRRHSSALPTVTALAWAGFALGLVLVPATLTSVMVTLVVPRGMRSRLTSVVSDAVTALFRLATARMPRYEDRDRVLSLAGAAVIVMLVVTWIALLFLGFALLLWPFTDASLGTALTVAGSSMFTLGFATAPGAGPTALIFLAAAVGLVVVALQIAYLPTIYSAFNRRETLVTMLESRGGVPAWGPEILARHELIDNVASLGALYARWEEWTADLAETHTTYGVLILFRSPHPLRSWITALLSVLDAAALHLSLNPLTAPAEARPLMRMGYMALREVATMMGIAYVADPRPEDPVQLTRAEFDAALEHLRSVGWRPERDPDEAWVHFRGWRVTYEKIAWAIADRVDAPPALWSGPRHLLATVGVAPQRPPHRAPPSERSKVLAITEARRRALPSLSGRRRDGRDAEDSRALRRGRQDGDLPVELAEPVEAARGHPATVAEREARADLADAAAEQPPD
jgi:hypothetical protein